MKFKRWVRELNCCIIVQQAFCPETGDDLYSIVPDPDPPDPRVFGLPDPDPLVRGVGPDPALDPDPSIIMQKL
jgi:hypothetical protein